MVHSLEWTVRFFAHFWQGENYEGGGRGGHSTYEYEVL